MSMSYAQFQSDILPSPFVAVDQMINTLVYGSFYDPPLYKLHNFLIPKTLFWSSQSYLLGSLYSYFSLESDTNTILYIWTGDVQTPTSSADDGITFVLGKTIDYNHDLLSDFCPFSYDRIHDFGKDDVLWSQHCYYASLCDCYIIPLMLPYQWLEDDHNKSLLNQLFTWIQKKNDISCVVIDDFEIQWWEENVDLIVSSYSLSEYYSNYIAQMNKHAHVLMVQPSTDDDNENNSWWVLWVW